MEGGENGGAERPSRPFGVWVIAGGLILSALATLVVGVLGLRANGDIGQFVSVVIFVVILAAPAYFAWKEKRGAYLAAAIVALLILVLYLVFSASSLTNPADGAFDFLAVLVPTLLLVAGFGIQAFRHGKTGLRQRRYLAFAQSTGGLITLAAAGFVAGMVVAGSIGAGVILRNTGATPADIKIVANAASVAIPFSPAVFHASVGQKVTWINVDITAHTVTSNVSGQFDSGLITTGQTWSWIFTTAGTYHYFCAIHPMMTGVVIVQ